MKQRLVAGFTLLEILIAMFIFTIISLILVGGLQSVIKAQSGTEKNAERLRDVQITLLMMSRDIEQAVDRPVMNEVGKENAAFMGNSNEFIFTHTGFANPSGTVTRSTMQRTGYAWHDGAIWRITTRVLDAVAEEKPHLRKLLDNVTSAQFQYLGKNGRFYDNWPGEGQTKQSLPRAVRINLTLKDWGSMSQLYVISAQPINKEQSKIPPPPPAPKS